MKRTILMILGTVATVAANAQWNSNPYYAATMQGGFVADGWSTRTSSGAPDPATVNVAMPGGSTVVKAYLNWNRLTNNFSDPGEAQVTFDGNAVSGSLAGVGMDLCWGAANGASYMADVTAYVSGNGAHSVGLAGDNAWGLGEGTSLVVFYSNPNESMKAVYGYAGYVTNLDAITTFDMNFTLGAYSAGPAHYFINAMDGQSAGDDFTINGNSIAGVLGGGIAGDCWLGVHGPYYDHADGDISAWMTSGDVLVQNNTIVFSDCIGHSFGAMSYEVVPEPASMIALGAALAGLIARRKKAAK